MPQTPAPVPPPVPPMSPEAADLRTARVMDHALAVAAATGVGAAGVRALLGARDMLARPSRVRGWPLARKSTVALPYAPREKEARRRGPIDAAANMRALNAGPAWKPSPGAPNAENPAIAANLAKTRANRAQPGYAASYARTNVEPYGRFATGTPSAIANARPASPSPHAPAEAIGARHAPGLTDMVAQQAAARPAPMLGAHNPVGVPPGVGPNPTPAAPKPATPPWAGVGAPPNTIGSFRPPAPAASPGLNMAGVGGRALTQPPGGRGVTPVGDFAANGGPGALGDFVANGGFKAAADEPSAPSSFARGMVSALGLGRAGAPDSTARDWLNPADATSAVGMPWAYLAYPALAAGAAGLGYVGADKAVGALRDADSQAEVDEAKERYERALHARVRKSAGEAGSALDALAAGRVKEGSLTAIPLGLLLAGGGLAAAGGAVLGSQMGGESPRRQIERAVRERQLAILQGPKRPIEIVPEPIDGEDD